MLRGFRWQLLALVIASVLFGAGLVLRLTEQDTLPQSTPPGVVQNVSPTPFVPPPSPTATQDSVLIEPITTGSTVTTYREGLVGNVQRLNPLLAGLNPVDRDITSLIFEGLTRTNNYGEVIPALATDWVISSDGLEYVVTLRDNVLWQDGVPFSAADVIYTMGLLRDDAFPGPVALGAFWRTVETEQLDTYLVRFRLSQPLGSFLSMLTIGILPSHALEGTSAAQLVDHPFNLSPIGTGPYQLEALRSNDGQHIDVVDLRVAPVYRQRAEGQRGFALERLRFQLYGTFDEAVNALQSGDIDALASRQRAERATLLNTGLSTYTAIEPTLGVVIFNWAQEDTNLFREQRVRLALETGLDRASIIERHLFNTVVKADSPLIPGSWAYAGDLFWPVYDATAARATLESANVVTYLTNDEGETRSTPVESISFSLLTPDDPVLVSVAQEIATQWLALGAAVTVETADDVTYQQRLETHDFDAALIELELGTDPDVYPYWHQGQYPDGKNYGGADDRFTSEALEQGRRDANGINRAIHYRDFQHFFVERAIALPLYYPLYTYVTAPDVTGVQLGFMGTPSDRFRTIQDWGIQR